MVVARRVRRGMVFRRRGSSGGGAGGLVLAGPSQSLLCGPLAGHCRGTGVNALVLAGSEPAGEDGGVGRSGINPRDEVE